MSLLSLGLVLVIGLVCWGSWPLITKASDISDIFVRGFLVNMVTVVGFLPFLPGRISGAWLIGGAGILLLAGVMNFAGHALFQKLQTIPGNQVSLYMGMIPGLVVLAGAIGGPIFYGEEMTVLKTLFTSLIVIGVAGLAFISLK
jgi:drug/metabolite transporter (DMT)-like permease